LTARSTILGAPLRAAARLYPFYSGLGTVGQLALFRACAPRKPTVVRLRNHLLLWVDPSEFVGRAIYYFRDLDRKLTFLLRRVLEPGDSFLDIGANIGLVSISVVDRVGPGGRVHAFEPLPQCVELLKKSIADNGLTNVEVHDFALSDRDGTQELGVSLDNIGASSLAPRPRHFDRKVTVRTIETGKALSQVVARDNRPYVVKIDVEGYEPVILERAAELFRSNPPKAILFEFQPRLATLGESPVFRMLADIGMAIYPIHRSLGRPSVAELSLSANATRAHDYLVVPRSRSKWLAERLAPSKEP
jgi:FkbM family methyltransferase